VDFFLELGRRAVKKRRLKLRSDTTSKLFAKTYSEQRFEPKKSWVFGLDLDGKPKTQKKSKNPKNPKSKPKKNPKIQKFQIQTQKKSKKPKNPKFKPKKYPNPIFFLLFKIDIKLI
jgi:hypothetical protein